MSEKLQGPEGVAISEKTESLETLTVLSRLRERKKNNQQQYTKLYEGEIADSLRNLADLRGGSPGIEEQMGREVARVEVALSQFSDDVLSLEFNAPATHEELEKQADDAAESRRLAELAGTLPWGPLQESMLLAEITDGRFGGMEMMSLCRRLRCTMEDAKDVWERTGEHVWTEKRMSKILEIEENSQRGYNWDRLESGVLRKLSLLVQSGQVKGVGELLAIGRVANVAHRRGPGGQIMDQKNPAGGGVNVNLQVNHMGGQGGGLPGAGNLGTLNLSLSERTIQQLSKPRTIEGSSERVTDRHEMLTPNDVAELKKKVEEL